jgi:hypothetical protein
MLNSESVEKHTALPVISFSKLAFPPTLQLVLIFFGTGFKAVTVVRICNVVCCLGYNTSYSGAWYECFWEAIWACLHRASSDYTVS